MDYSCTYPDTCFKGTNFKTFLITKWLILLISGNSFTCIIMEGQIGNGGVRISERGAPMYVDKSSI